MPWEERIGTFTVEFRDDAPLDFDRQPLVGDIVMLRVDDNDCDVLIETISDLGDYSGIVVKSLSPTINRNAIVEFQHIHIHRLRCRSAACSE